MKMLILLPFIFLSAPSSVDGVQLSATSSGLYYNGIKVFLSGVNIAWNSYGYDFGNNQYASMGPKLESWLDEIKLKGGNSVRIWVHVEGSNTPNWDQNGYVLSPDKSGSLISDMKKYLDAAKSRNIVVIFVLWNGAELRNQNAINLVWDDSKLQTYIDKALKPMARALKGHPALGAWEIINEFEGSVYAGKSDSNKCFDTKVLQGSGAGWTGLNIPMQRYLRFINWQLSAIRDVDPVTLLTVGSWSEKSQNSAFAGSYNYHTDACLIAAGGKTNGLINFYQMHTYSWNKVYNPSSPLKSGNTASSFKLNKPIVIGEFASQASEGQTIQQLMNYAYNNGYAGALGWQYNIDNLGSGVDNRATLNLGLQQLKGKLTPKVNFVLV